MGYLGHGRSNVWTSAYAMVAHHRAEGAAVSNWHKFNRTGITVCCIVGAMRAVFDPQERFLDNLIPIDCLMLGLSLVVLQFIWQRGYKEEIYG